MTQRLEDLEDWADADSWIDADGWTEAGGWAEPVRAQVLREVMHQDYAGADDEAYDDALEALLDGMSPAEAFSFTKALQQLERGGAQAMANPLAGQVARTALPLGAGALGTLIGGPAGTAVGSHLGTLAAGALVKPGQPGQPGQSGRPATVTAGPPAAGGTQSRTGAVSPGVAGGSAAAAQAAVLAQLPHVTGALMALAMGRHGATQVGGVPVADIMNMLSSVYGQAAADADELAFLDGERAAGGEFDEDDGEYAEPALGTGRCLYTALIDAENDELAS